MLTPGSKPIIQRTRLGYSEDLISFPITNSIESMVKSATMRRAPLPDIRADIDADQLEGGLMPPLDILKNSSLSIVPASGVSVLGGSRLMMVVSKVLPTEIQRVLVDAEDYGATALGQLLFPRKISVRPEFYRSEYPLDPTQYDLMQNDGYDAYLLCGRHGFFVRKDAFAWTWDLTQAWYDLTQLPFPFLCWCVKKSARTGTLDRELVDVVKRTETGLADVCSRAAERNAMTQSTVGALYTRAFSMNFDHQTVSALRRYAQEIVQNRVAMIHPLSFVQAGTGTSTRK